jgi:hypothetical protein
VLTISIVSFLHTLLSALITLFRSITLANILQALQMIGHSLLELPGLIYRGIEYLEYFIEKTFGLLYWIVKVPIVIIYSVVSYIPEHIWWILKTVGGGIWKGCKEAWLYFWPKSMA